MSGRQQEEAYLYARMSTNDIRRARQLAHGDAGKLDEIIAEKVAAQIAECREYAAGEDWAVQDTASDNMISGSDRYRKAGDSPVERIRMLRQIRAQGSKAVIVVTEVARLYRSTDESRELVKLAEYVPITVATVDDEKFDLTTEEGEAAFEAAVSRAQRESAVVSRRRRRKEAKRARAGHYWGSRPFGYHKVYDTDPEDGKRYYTGRIELCDETCPGRDGCMNTRPADFGDYDGDEDPAPRRGDVFRRVPAGGTGPALVFWQGEAGLIRAAARWLAGRDDEPGHSLHSIVKEWDAYGVRTPRGGRWNQPQLRNLLLNKRLNGVRVHHPGDKWGRAGRKGGPPLGKGAEYPNAWPKVLDDDLFLAVRGVLMNPDRFKHVRKDRDPRKHLLAGLAVCGNILPDGSACGAKMKGHPAGRPRADGTRLRQYQCPAPPDGCAHCRRDTAAADKYVIGLVLAWTRPGDPCSRHESFTQDCPDCRPGPYAQYAARELEIFQANQVTAGAELARLDAEQREAANLLAGFSAAMASGEITHGSAAWDVTMTAIEKIDAEQRTRARREVELRAARPPARIHERHATLAATLTDPDGDITVRSDLIRSFVARVIIRPPGQGVRSAFDTDSIQVIPGPWADGLPAADMAACVPPASRRREDMRARIMGYLADHPDSASRDIAAAIGSHHSSVCSALAVMRDAGEVAPDRPGRGGPAPILYTLTGHDSGKALWASQVPRSGMAGASVREAVTAHLAANPGSAAADIADKAGIPRPSVYMVVKDMREAGQIIPDRPGRGNRSQPILYSLPG